MKNKIFFSIIAGIVTLCLFCQTVSAANPPTINSPGNSSSPGPVLTTLTPTFSWNSASGATGYGLYIRDLTTGNLIYPNSSGITYTPLTGTSYTLSSGYLVYGHSYRWNMTSFVGSTEGTSVSSSLYFQSPAATASPPTINSPGSSSSPGPVLTTLTPTFSWNTASGATGYGLYIRDLTTGNLIYPNSSGITYTPLTGTSFTLPSGYLVNGHSYRWDMTSFTGSTESASVSSVLYFQSPVAIADPPTINSPGSSGSPGPVLTTLTPTFSWNTSSGATGYGLYIRDMTASGTPLIYPNSSGTTATPLTGTSFTLPSGLLVSGHNYKWDMTSFVGSTESTGESTPLYFQDVVTVGPPTTISPGTAVSPGPSVSTLTPTFTWNSVSGVTGYGLYIRDMTALGTPLIYPNASGTTATPLTGTSFALPIGYLVSGHVYKWNMSSFIGSTESTTFSTPLYFQDGIGIVGFYLSFPLAGLSPYTATINSVFDHSMSGSYAKDNTVIAYTGETAQKMFGVAPDLSTGYKNAGGTPFIINGHYSGGSADNSLAIYLYYDGHPGYDYRAADGTPVYAVADGTAHYPSSFPGISDAASWHTLAIDHGNGYISYYLHLSMYAGTAIVSEGQIVHRGDLIAYSGHAAPSSSPVGPHLHYEIQKGGVPVDPYGWTGSGSDPYTLAVNVNLWSPPETPTPSISTISPPSMPASSINQTLTITGSNFDPAATLTFDPPTGANIDSTEAKFISKSASQLVYQINNANDFGIWLVRVNNPGGVFSGWASFTVTPAVPPSCQGVDYSSSHPSPGGLKAAGYNFAIRYVSGAGAPKDLNTSEMQSLQSAGIDIIAIFESTADRMLDGYNAGVADANTAVTVATAVGAPQNFFCYFACDFDAQPSDQTAINAYLDGAASVLGAQRVGFYGSYGPLKNVLDAGKAAKGWQTEAWSHGNLDLRISLYQHAGQVTIAGGTCDIDDGYGNDLGQWSIPLAITGVGGGLVQPPNSGTFQVEIHSSQAQVTVQVSDDMMHWTDFGTLNIVDGKAALVDVNAGAHTERYYRLKP